MNNSNLSQNLESKKPINSILKYTSFGIMVTISITVCVWMIDLYGISKEKIKFNDDTAGTYFTNYLRHLPVLKSIVEYLLFMCEISSVLLFFVIVDFRHWLSLKAKYFCSRVCLFVLIFASFIVLLHVIKIWSALASFNRENSKFFNGQGKNFIAEQLQLQTLTILIMTSLVLFMEIGVTYLLPKQQQKFFRKDEQNSKLGSLELKKKQSVYLKKIRKNSEDFSLNSLINNKNHQKSSFAEFSLEIKPSEVHQYVSVGVGESPLFRYSQAQQEISKISETEYLRRNQNQVSFEQQRDHQNHCAIDSMMKGQIICDEHEQTNANSAKTKIHESSVTGNKQNVNFENYQEKSKLKAHKKKKLNVTSSKAKLLQIIAQNREESRFDHVLENQSLSSWINTGINSDKLSNTQHSYCQKNSQSEERTKRRRKIFEEKLASEYINKA